MPRAELSLSVTELPQFRRLVDFVVDVGEYAHEQGDEGLQSLLQDLADDLLRAST